MKGNQLDIYSLSALPHGNFNVSRDFGDGNGETVLGHVMLDRHTAQFSAHIISGNQDPLIGVYATVREAAYDIAVISSRLV